jgi:small subunit ribosomal protein S9
MQNNQKYYHTGRRKTSSARVWIAKGSGKITIDSNNLEARFPKPALKAMILEPFAVAGAVNEYDVFCTVSGGGDSGQAGAIRHGISQALVLANPVLRMPLKAAGLLTRDARKVERKKYGKKKARRSFQFCKR